MATHERLAAAASKNAELLRGLAETDWAPTSLKQVLAYVHDVQTQISQTDKLIAELNHKTNVELKDHEKYRDSRMRRFAYRMGGKTEKFEAKAEKEEREYFEAVQEEKKARDRRDMLVHQLEEANKNKAEFEIVAKRNAELQAELQALYNSIFAGATPEFPEEDRAEEAVRQAQAAYGQSQQWVKAEEQVAWLLSNANKTLQQSLAEIDEALSYSKMDAWGVGGGFADMGERHALSKASSGVSQVEMWIEQARRIQPAVGSLGPMNIARGNMLGDVLFDSFFSDLRFHEKIRDSQAQLQRASQRLALERQNSSKRIAECNRNVDQAAARLENARKELQHMRQRAFEQVASSG